MGSEMWQRCVLVPVLIFYPHQSHGTEKNHWYEKDRAVLAFFNVSRQKDNIPAQRSLILIQMYHHGTSNLSRLREKKTVFCKASFLNFYSDLF